MKTSYILPLAAVLSTACFASAPRMVAASAIYYCNNGNCSSSGGNGDNGTNNGNNSSDNTINVNLDGSGSKNGSAYANRNSLSVPIQLPSIAAAGCGTRTTLYAGLTGTPNNGVGFGNSSSLGFGLGILNPIGKEPDSCKPPTVNYTSNTYINGAAPAGATHAMSPSRYEPADVQPAAAASSGCVPIDYDVAAYYAHDFRVAKQHADTSRIERDMRALEHGCFHSMLVEAIAGR